MEYSRAEGTSRRAVLRLLVAGGAASALPGAVGAQDDGRSVALEQDDRCAELIPLSGDVPVEEFYDYRYPVDRYDGPPGSEGTTYSSHGTTDLQRDDTSLLFLYDGPDGLSLVVIHGNLEGEGTGGTIRFAFEGLPSDGEWVVRDDYYLRDGEPVASNYDSWDVDGETHTVDWAYRGSRTDGGVFRGLDRDLEVTVDPAFNDEAPLSADHDFGPVASWEALSFGDDDPERHALALDEPVTLRAGECQSGGDDFGGAGEVDARILGLSVPEGVYTVGEEVPATVTVRNTGERDHRFVVGYSAVDPQGVGHHNDGTTDEAVTVAAGETTTKTVTWTVERDAPSGTYDAKVIIWRDRDGDELSGNLDRRVLESAFQVVAQR